MIRVTKLSGKTIMLNADWIQSIESTPDTLITLTTGFQLMVKEKVEAVVGAVVGYKRLCGQAPLTQLTEEMIAEKLTA